MGKVAFIFPGQGSQYVGMGKEVAENYPVAAETFAEANDVLAYDLMELCFNGPEDQLKDTRNAQPGIMTTSVALLRVLESEGCQPDFVAGHSLGEYSALVASKTLSFRDGLKLVQRRSRLMAEADPDGNGAMAAVLGLDRATVIECLDIADGQVEAANFNCPGQIVVSGTKTGLAKVQDEVLGRGGKFIPLAVTGAFHSSFMKPAADQIYEQLKQTEWNEPVVPLISNVDAAPATKDTLAEKLYRQIFSSVLWEDTLHYLADHGVDTFVEIGPGKVLSGLVKKTLKGVNILQCEDLTSLKKALAILKEV
ncbi:MAG TPA: ACP S-malonyltransferase [Bacillota bacterium]|nr:ACP S-malonyltransferase [Bacillota bacterium]HPT88077.1 ACP S-malonyltransferase [Bacillota bacterium]